MEEKETKNDYRAILVENVAEIARCGSGHP